MAELDSRYVDNNERDSQLVMRLIFKKGFDLVCEEASCRPLKAFASQLLRFQEDCRIAGVEIPFLFHCGGTLEAVAEADGNMAEALLLGSKRIGLGFELMKSLVIMDYMKRNEICVEICAISDHDSEFAPKMNEHLIHRLLANNVHCTMNLSDGTLLRSALFLEVFKALANFNEFVFRKLNIDVEDIKNIIVWSIEHACLSKTERWKIMEQWKTLWEKFLLWVIDTYGGLKLEGHESAV